MNTGTPSQSSAGSWSAHATGSLTNSKVNENRSEKIFQQLDNLEQDLSKLVTSINRFQPSKEAAHRLVSDVDELNYTIDDLLYIHDKRRSQVLNQEVENRHLNKSMINIMIGLTECRKELKKLPNLTEEQLEKVYTEKLKREMNDGDVDMDAPIKPLPSAEENLKDVETLLEYAMKLSKFSKIPASVDPNTLNPRNFIWPGEDSMRRGMLALASIHHERLIETLNESTINPGGESTINNEQEVAETPSPSKSTKEHNNTTTKGPNQETDAQAAIDGLDLFDSDEDL
ncbi:RNA polymerase II mediator complex subunit 4 [Komagataella phaffii CBS 7435]|uniref:Mediator of RNA polymerase II transcription subunit 4 n=2 Tax=Komagataella phaffii TaxID=460519 RepID=C4R425_KOMPG|nr:Hypothetical protein PAS_chr3_0272 [Komagataella phaffii GS115]AOA63303.1 GQ67_03325T0 [Komagataella phaffii]CAH2449945.1 RNA polymerase II mediator complex subunit 4 [Komagataella phaffii CBS 7435]AOA69261.1 GQ68_03294T0 [Komagataella phaffii GS115]CAY70311.1 Hypothetical protein PAS_chr3_0272 [Komagataella phaffii GS115]CCA39895.1 RNA polymerase II mediator complex subunit 4 [Komagataella phaffii CBS 7435]